MSLKEFLDHGSTPFLFVMSFYLLIFLMGLAFGGFASSGEPITDDSSRYRCECLE